MTVALNSDICWLRSFEMVLATGWGVLYTHGLMAGQQSITHNQLPQSYLGCTFRVFA